MPLDAVVDYLEGQGLDVVAVHEALDRLAQLDSRQAQAMTLRYFGGLTVPEVAEALEEARVDHVEERRRRLLALDSQQHLAEPVDRAGRDPLRGGQRRQPGHLPGDRHATGR